MSRKKNKKREVMNEVRDVMRPHHYWIHTKSSYCDWIQVLIFHNIKSRDSLKEGEQIIVVVKPG